MSARVCRLKEEGAVVQHLTDRQPALLAATDAGRLGLPRVGHALATFSRRYPVGVGAALVLCMIALLAVLAPMVAPYDPNFQHFNDMQQAPSAKYWLGTDYEGRDVLSRLIYGGRVSLTVAVLSVLLGTVVGSVWGVASAYLGGTVDLLSQRVVEVLMSFPTLVLATAHLGTAIVIEATLGFLGIGITPPTASWGNMLGGVVANTYKPLWWLVVFPGLSISLTVLAFNLLGDTLRDILDPKMRGW